MTKTIYTFHGKELSYEVTEDGYFIYLNGNKWIHQYEPYIPDHNISYEENAVAQIKELVKGDEATVVEKQV